MNYLGIDYGEKRIGLAKADSSLKIAIPFKTIVNGPGILNDLADIVSTQVIEKIIVGVPISFSGGKNKFAAKIMEFAEDLEARTGTPVELMNEIFSSKMAFDHSRKIDESAAAVILQSFLDKGS